MQNSEVLQYGKVLNMENKEMKNNNKTGSENSSNSYNAIGIMTGTSLDGIDVAFVKISRENGNNSKGKDKLEFIDFYFQEYPEEVREYLLYLAQGGSATSRDFILTSQVLGKLYVEAVEGLLSKHECVGIDLIGIHGQTIYHSLEKEEYLGMEVSASYQIAEPSYLSERFKCPVISDFRIRDIAAGGLGAPLVPFVEYALSADEYNNAVFLNIGGISNITYISEDVNEIMGFDTGPGNMLIDQAMIDLYDKTYDKDGEIARSGKVSEELLDKALKNPYYEIEPPKNSGRENFGPETYQYLKAEALKLDLAPEDFVMTLTALTAKVNADAIQKFCPRLPKQLIVSGGGSENGRLMQSLAELLPGVEVLKGEVLGYPNAAKEAIAFAYLGYKTLLKEENTIAQVTGAEHPVVMGKITY